MRNYWQRAELVDNVGVVGCTVFRRIRLRQVPPYVHLLMARDTFDPWAAVSLRRIELNYWALARYPDFRRSGNQTLRILWSAAAANIDRNSRRWPRAFSPCLSETRRPIRLEVEPVPSMPPRRSIDAGGAIRDALRLASI